MKINEFKKPFIVSAKLESIDYEGKMINFSFVDKNGIDQKGYCEFFKLGDMNNEDIKKIFWPNSNHLCLVKNYNNIIDAYRLDYSCLHPEVFTKPFRIIPTNSHSRKLYKYLVEKIDEYKFDNSTNIKKD